MEPAAFHILNSSISTKQECFCIVLTRQSFDYFTILDFSIAEVSKYTLDNRKGEIEIVSEATLTI